MTLTDEILQRCAHLGFARAGVCRAEPATRADALRDWLADGRHGEMDYLRAWGDKLADPARAVAGVRSIICVGDRYHDGEPDPAAIVGTGRIARYARGRDYHRVIKRRLHDLCDELRERFPDETFRACVDTAPLLEREHATRAGLGAIGKHTLLIEQGVGSYLLLGEIVTTLSLEPTESADADDPCGTCTRCIDACPTEAITPWSVDATRCISYLTIEHRTAIDERLFAGMGDWLFGCDVCQEGCPHNQPTNRTREAPVPEAYAPRRTGLDVAAVLGWTEDDRREAFTQSAMKRARLAMMKRNALIVAGNMIARGEGPGLRERVEEIAGEEGEDAMVRETARVVLGRLGPQQ
jgi:epoxyqueuosine reductase